MAVKNHLAVSKNQGISTNLKTVDDVKRYRSSALRLLTRVAHVIAAVGRTTALAIVGSNCTEDAVAI
jgi:hypothetical protein